MFPVKLSLNGTGHALTPRHRAINLPARLLDASPNANGAPSLLIEPPANRVTFFVVTPPQRTGYYSVIEQVCNIFSREISNDSRKYQNSEGNKVGVQMGIKSRIKVGVQMGIKSRIKVGIKVGIESRIKVGIKVGIEMGIMQ